MGYNRKSSKHLSKIISNAFVEEKAEWELYEKATDFSQMTILQMMEKLTLMAEDSELSDEFFDNAMPISEALGKRLELTPCQAVLYSIFIDNYNDKQITLSDIQRYTRARMVRLAQLQNDIDAIEKHRYIRRSQNSNIANIAYCVPYESLNDLRENRPYKPQTCRNLSLNMFLRELNTAIISRYNYAAPFELVIEDVMNLIGSNKQLQICKVLDAMKVELDIKDWVFLVVVCNCDVYHNSSFSIAKLHKIFDDTDCEIILRSLESKTNRLQKDGLLEFGFSDGLEDSNCVQLTKKAKTQLLGGLRSAEDTDNETLLDCNKIQFKKMFYNKDVEMQVARLGDLLSIESFHKICDRLKSRGMRQGFTCLFYGTPGTGKTETVLQLAKKTGRNIFQVDFADIKNKYVGETEKNVKAIFEKYREAVRNEKEYPILLFNEADAIIGKRIEKIDHAVDNMYNSMQNIILQEMENFEGILIATTNLEGNMDSAFERRFLYKVQFEKPSVDVRSNIWQSIIPQLPEDIAGILAKNHDFSGGQIENIARKYIVDEILYGENGDIYTRLKEYCNNEMINKHNLRPSVGYKYQPTTQQANI